MENVLIKITTNEDGKQLVSGRELHEFLGMKKYFTDWIKPYIKDNNDYGFAESIDFTRIHSGVNPTNGVPIVDYVLTLDMAKELGMLSKSEKGRQARKYFIECEKKLKEVSSKALLLEKIYNGGQEGVLASKQLTELEVKEATKPLLDKIEEDKPMVDFANTISASADSIDMGKFAKLVKDEEVFRGGRNKLFNWLRDSGYLMRDNTPYQRYIDSGIFEFTEYTYKTPYGEKIGHKTLVTPKGQIYLIEKLRNK